MALIDSIRSLFGKNKDEELNNIPTAQPKFNLSSAIKSIGSFLNRGFEANKAIGEKIIIPATKPFIQPVVRSVPETAMSIYQAISGKQVPQVETPKNPVADYLVGDKPLKTIQQRVPEFSKEYNVPTTIAAPAVLLGTALDLPGPGMVKNIFKEGAEKIVKKLSKDFVEDAASYTLKEFGEKVPKTFLEKLMKEGTIETATHTIKYDPVDKFIDILPKAKTEAKAGVKIVKETIEELPKPNTKNIKITKPKDVYVDEFGETIPKPKNLKVKTPEETIPTLIRTDSGKIIKPTTKFGEPDIPPVRQSKKLANTLMDEADAALDAKYNAKPFTDIPEPDVPIRQGAFETTQRQLNKELPGTKVTRRGEATVPAEVYKELEQVKPQVSAPFKQTPRVFEGFFGKGSATEKWINGGLKKATQDFQNYIKANYEKIKPLFSGLSKAEREAITLFGEKKISPEELMTQFPNSYQKIINADIAIRQYFDEAFDLVNDSRVRVGLEPIGYTDNYYTIMEDTTKKASEMLNNQMDVRGYSVNKNKWVSKFAGFLKSRKPEAVVENRLLDAQEILSDYIRSAGYQINITPAIERMNNLAKAGRDLAAKMPDNAALTGYTNWLEYRAGLLAGKKSSGEIALGQTFSPILADFLKTIRGSVGRNLVTKSPTSGFTNLVPLIKYVIPEAGTDNLAIGIKRALTSPMTEANNFTINGIQSQFLRNRYEVPGLTQTTLEKLANLEWPLIGFKKMDEFSANSAFYAVQEKFLKEGKSLAEATQLADNTLAKILTDRSLGQLPNLIMDKGLGSLFTMFLPERLNELFLQYGDTLTGLKGPAKLKAISNFIYYTMAGLAVNELSTAVFGRPFTDSIATAIEDTIKEHSETDSIFDTGLDFVKAEASQFPFTEVLAGGSKLPITAGFPTVRELTEEPWIAAAKFATVYADPTGFGVPVLRAVRAGQAINQGYVGGSQVKYPVPQDALQKVKMLLLGTSSTPEAQEYYDRNYTPLSEQETFAYKQIYQSGNDEQAYTLWKALEAKKYINNPVAKLQSLQRATALEMANAKSEEERDEIARRFTIMVGKSVDEIKKRAGVVIPELQDQVNKSNAVPFQTTGMTRTSTKGTYKPIKPTSIKLPKLKVALNKTKQVGVQTGQSSVAKIKPIEQYKSDNKLARLRVTNRQA